MAQSLTAVSAKSISYKLSFAVHASLLTGFLGLIGFVASACSHVH